MSGISSKDILRFVAKWNETQKRPFSLNDLLMAFPGIDSDTLLAELDNLVQGGFVEKAPNGFYVPTELGTAELAAH